MKQSSLLYPITSKTLHSPGYFFMLLLVLQLRDVCGRGLGETCTLIQGRESTAPSSAHFPSVPANGLHFCHGKNSCGDQEATT